MPLRRKITVMWKATRAIARSFTVITFFLVSSVLAAAPEQRAALHGVWTGSSSCTNVRPACNDEKALYRISSKPGGDNLVDISAGKVVDGKEVVMGVIPFHADYQ